MKRISFLFIAIAPFIFFSCVSNKQFNREKTRYNGLNTSYLGLQKQLSACNDASKDKDARIQSLEEQMKGLKAYNEQQKSSNDELVNQLKNLSVISSSQAESIKKSLDNISSKDAYIKDLQSAIAHKDSLNMALVINLKGVIGDLNDKDINIKVDKGVIYIDISDKLLFKTASYDVNDRAKEVLGKVAKVLMNQPDIEFMVEGNTDSVPYHHEVLVDNWDLSVKRATSVVRILQNEYGIPPSKMTAGGRGEYTPVASNETADGRTLNRRTRIVILPQLDQFFRLLEQKHDL